MASVHLGRLRGDAGFSRVVAIKCLHASFTTDPSFVEMFTDEARLAARIRHANVVSTLDVVASGNELFHVIDYVHGETVAKLLSAARKAGELVPVDVAVRIVCDVLYGLHAAHEATDEQGRSMGLVHRDVSPQNLMVGVDGVTRVLDFGVAKARGLSRTTETGRVKGKIGYMAPEQLYGEKVDRRADVYAAGVVFWEMLAGKRLFEGEEGGDALALVLTAPIWRPSIHHADVPEDLDAIVLRALERDRSKRFSTAQEMADAVVTAVVPAAPSKVAAWVRRLAGPAIDQRARLMANVEAQVDDDASVDFRPAVRSLLGDTTTSSMSMTQTKRPRTRWSLALAVLVVVALLSMALLVWVGRQDAGPAVLEAAAGSSGSAPSDAASIEPALSASAVLVPSALPPAVQPRPPRPPRTAVVPGAVKLSCDPPWDIDEKGHRRYKRECLR
jgi:serine/threonine-protein kinase